MRSEGKFCALFVSCLGSLSFFWVRSMYKTTLGYGFWERKDFSGRSRAMVEPDLALETKECEGGESVVELGRENGNLANVNGKLFSSHLTG